MHECCIAVRNESESALLPFTAGASLLPNHPADLCSTSSPQLQVSTTKDKKSKGMGKTKVRDGVEYGICEDDVRCRGNEKQILCSTHA